MTQAQIAKLEKEIEKKVQTHVKPAKTRKEYRIDVQRLKQLAQKIREFETQSDASAIR